MTSDNLKLDTLMSLDDLPSLLNKETLQQENKRLKLFLKLIESAAHEATEPKP